MADIPPTAAPLILTPEAIAALHALRHSAADTPVDVREVKRALETARGERRHRAQMTAQSVVIPGPWPFYVTFSIETGQPCGTSRHMSMSVMRAGRVPHPLGVWLVAEELGFSGGLDACHVWPEELKDGGTAINILQPIAVQQAGAA